MKIKVKKLDPRAILPGYAHPGDAGLDLYSLEDYTLLPGRRHFFRLGLAIEIPEGYVGLVWDRSGLAREKGLTHLGGVVDAGFRGEVAVILLNTSTEVCQIKKGERIAQLIIQPVERVEIEEVNKLNPSTRGEDGWGSTGK